MADFQFTNNWFDANAKAVWDQLIPQLKPSRILEIGSYEGASACYLIKTLGSAQKLEVHCIDTWQGGVEHQKGAQHQADMTAVEARFKHNIALAQQGSGIKPTVHVIKGMSDVEMSRLLADGKRNYFDFIYIDGSHQAPDVLCDAVLSFRLLKVGGLIAFDDYLWFENLPYGVDPIRCPKPAIDAFVNLYCRKVRILSAPLSQLYVQKIAD